MRIATRWTFGAAFAIVLAVTASAHSGKKFVVTDDCDPNAADWTGGCLKTAARCRAPSSPQQTPADILDIHHGGLFLRMSGSRKRMTSELKTPVGEGTPSRMWRGSVAAISRGSTHRVSRSRPSVRSQTRTARYHRPRRLALPCWLQEPSCASKTRAGHP